MEGTGTPALPVRTMSWLRRLTAVACLVAACFGVPGTSRGDTASPETLALFDAVERNDFDTVRRSVAEGARIEFRSSFGMRPVDLAIERGHYEIAHYLLSLHNVRESTNTKDTEGTPSQTLPKAPMSDASDSDERPSAFPSVPPPPPLVADSSSPSVDVNPAVQADEQVPTAKIEEPAASLAIEPPAPPSLPKQQEPPPAAEAQPKAPKHNAYGNQLFDQAVSRIRRITGSFEETVDTFLGGWFFRWAGRQLARNDPPETSDRSLAVADLVSPDEAAPPLAGPATPAPDNAVTVAKTAPSPLAPSEQAQSATVRNSPEDGALSVNPRLTPEPAAPSSDGVPEMPTGRPPVMSPSLAQIGPASQPRLSAPVQASTQPSSYASPVGTAPTSLENSPPKPATAPIDPFAPEAVAPGARHPVIGGKPRVGPALPQRDETTNPLSVPPAPLVAPSGESTAMASNSSPEEPTVGKAEPAAAAWDTGDSGTSKRAKAAGDPVGMLDKLPQIQMRAKPRITEPTGDRPHGLDGPTGSAPSFASTATLPIKDLARTAPASVLTLGDSIYITAAMPPAPPDPSEGNHCVKKDRGTVVFCVEPVDWPSHLVGRLRVTSIMYQGAQAIVRYDNGLATRVHAIFPTDSYGALIDHYTQRLGEPTASGERMIAPFAQPRQSNQVVSWQRLDPLTNEKTTLEIRRHDDTRGGFPDMRHGALMLYNTASPPIFPVLSTLDLMPTATD